MGLWKGYDGGIVWGIGKGKDEIRGWRSEWGRIVGGGGGGGNGEESKYWGKVD